MTTQTDTAPLSAKELARTAWSAIVKEMGNGPFGFEAEEIIAAAIRQYHDGRATQAEAREAGMREALEPFVAAAVGMVKFDLPDEAAVLRASADWHLRSGEGEPLTMGDFRKLAALSPAQPAQGADPLVTAYDNGVDHAWGVAKPLAEAAEGVINWCDFAMSQPGEFDPHGVRNLSGPAFDKLRETVEAARSAGLLTTETTEVGNG